jgi:hypothetical protein
MELDGLDDPSPHVSAPAAETSSAFNPLRHDHEDVATVRDAVFDLTGVRPRIKGAVVSVLGNGERETLHSHPDHYFAVCHTPIRGVALTAHGVVIKEIAFDAGDVIAFNPLPPNTPHRLQLSTGGSQAAISYVAYSLPAGTPYPKPGLYKPGVNKPAAA